MDALHQGHIEFHDHVHPSVVTFEQHVETVRLEAYTRRQLGPDHDAMSTAGVTRFQHDDQRHLGGGTLGKFVGSVTVCLHRQAIDDANETEYAVALVEHPLDEHRSLEKRTRHTLQGTRSPGTTASRSHHHSLPRHYGHSTPGRWRTHRETTVDERSLDRVARRDRRYAVKVVGWVLAVLSAPLRERRVRVLVYLLVTFTTMVTTFSVVFHLLMDREGQSHSWITSVYWTLVTMTTLGFGDITFYSDLGRLFSVVVLLSGSIFILVLLPFTFIQFVFAPWMERRNRSRVPSRMPSELSGHLVLTSLGSIEDELIRRADRARVPYVLIEPSLETALAYRDRGYTVMLGEVDDPDTYRAAGVERAALVATTRSDPANSNIVFTVREICPDVPIVATANDPAAMDVLELAGANRAMRMGDMLGETLARRVLSPDARCRRIGEVAGLHIAEAPVIGTPLVGQTIAELNLRARVGVNVIGVYLRGHFELAGPQTTLEASSVLILAGTTEQLDAYDELFGHGVEVERPVIIIGGGRVGRAAGAALAATGLEYRIVEQRAERVRDPEHYVLGNAADLAVLEQAGIRSTTTVVITTHDDDVNVYLTLYCRRLRPDLQVIARANLDRNVSTLYRAGADSVGSYASTGATAMWNQFRADDTLRVEEDLDVFRVPVPAPLAGRTLADCHLRRRTGCNVVALVRNGHARSHPTPDEPLPPEAELILIGDREAETRFLQEFPAPRSRRR